MIYLENTTESQRVFIPRTDIEASAYHPSTGGTEQYYAGQNIEITPSNVINVTGLTEAIQEQISGITMDYATTAQVETMISAATSDFVTSGDVESQITSQTQNLVTSGDVETMISAATSGMVTTDALTAYTPTNGFATINGSAITEGGNIEIQGGSSDYLPQIQTLPSPPDTEAVYNYNGVLIRYHTSPGKWGDWKGETSTLTYQNAVPGSLSLFYAVIPDELDGTALCGLGYIKSSTAQTQIWCFYDKIGLLKFYNNSSMTGSTLYTVSHNGEGETYINNSNVQCYVSWVGNVIQFRPANGYVQVWPFTDCTTNNSHFELAQELKYTYPISRDSSFNNLSPSSFPPYWTVRIDPDGTIMPGQKMSQASIYVNNNNYSNVVNFYGSKPGSINNIYVPITSGDTGTLCVSQGVNQAPVWKTIAQALGVDFWTGTQLEYDALGTPHNPTTLYFIKDV